MHHARRASYQPFLWCLLVGWFVISAGVLGWWAYTQPNPDICVAPVRAGQGQ